MKNIFIRKKKLLWVGLYFVKKIQNSKPKPNDRKQKVKKQQTTSVAIIFNSRENSSVTSKKPTSKENLTTSANLLSSFQQNFWTFILLFLPMDSLAILKPITTIHHFPSKSTPFHPSLPLYFQFSRVCFKTSHFAAVKKKPKEIRCEFDSKVNGSPLSSDLDARFLDKVIFMLFLQLGFGYYCLQSFLFA